MTDDDNCRLALRQGEAVILAVVQNGLEGQKTGHTFWAFRPDVTFPLAFGLPLLAYHLQDMDNYLWREQEFGPDHLCWKEHMREPGSVGHKVKMVSKKPGNVLREQPYSMNMDAMELNISRPGGRKTLFEGHGTCSEVVSGHLLHGRSTMVILPCAPNDHMIKILEQHDVRIALRGLKATVTPAMVLQK